MPYELRIHPAMSNVPERFRAIFSAKPAAVRACAFSFSTVNDPLPLPFTFRHHDDDANAALFLANDDKRGNVFLERKSVVTAEKKIG